MIKHALVAAILFGSAGFASAATLNYYGHYYAQTEGSGPSYDYGLGSHGASYVFPDGYNKGMRVELSLELDKPLAANETFEIDYMDESILNRPELLSFSASDGLYTRTDEEPGFIGLMFYGWMQTDDFGHVSAWDLLLYNGSAGDYDAFGTSSSGGDYAHHSREYMTFDENGDLQLAGVWSRASVDNPGVWIQNEVPAPIPLPASSPLVLSGIGLLGFVRSRSRRS